MNITFRRLTSSDSRLLDDVTRMCMETVLETIPEFAGDEERARKALPNFTFDEMRAMLDAGCRNEAHRIVAALNEKENLCGYSIYSLKRDAEGILYGYLFSRRIDPSYRRFGIATRLLEGAEKWFHDEGAEYVQAETHVANLPLRTMLEKNGFVVSGPFEGSWPYYVLRKDLAVRSDAPNEGADRTD